MNFPTRAIASFAFATLASTAQATVIYSLADNGASLISFDSSTPAAVTTVGISGVAFLDGLDFRPADGLLYGYEQGTSDNIYRVDRTTGMATLVSTSTAPVTTARLGIDFNPVPDRLRVVTQNDENRRINVDTGAAIIDGMLAYAAGDPNDGVNPNIIDAAYTNHDNNPLTLTTLYYIDFILDALITTTNPNGGFLNTVGGGLGFDTNFFTGFDIFTDSFGVNTAFASLTVGGTPGLYTIDLATGAASLVGAISASNLYGLAVAPIPEPSSLALLAAAGLAAFRLRQRGVVTAAR